MSIGFQQDVQPTCVCTAVCLAAPPRSRKTSSPCQSPTIVPDCTYLLNIVKYSGSVTLSRQDQGTQAPNVRVSVADKQVKLCEAV